MNTQALADELSQLLATETRSLCRHLDEAKPYLTPRTYCFWRDIQAMAHTSEEHSRRLASLFDVLERTPGAVTYRTDVANYHFMSLDALLPRLIKEKQTQITAYERAIVHAGDRADVAGELAALLAENRGQLETLQAALPTSAAAR